MFPAIEIGARGRCVVARPQYGARPDSGPGAAGLFIRPRRLHARGNVCDEQRHRG